MVLLNISASKGQPSEMTMNTLDLGISILRGGNVDVQMVRPTQRRPAPRGVTDPGYMNKYKRECRTDEYYEGRSISKVKYVIAH